MKALLHEIRKKKPRVLESEGRYRGPIIYNVFNDYVDDVLDPTSLIKSFEFVNIMDGSSHSFVCWTFYRLCAQLSFAIKIVCFRINFVHDMYTWLPKSSK